MPVFREQWRRDHDHQWCDVIVTTMVGSIINGFGVVNNTVIMAASFKVFLCFKRMNQGGQLAC